MVQLVLIPRRSLPICICRHRNEGEARIVSVASVPQTFRRLEEYRVRVWGSRIGEKAARTASRGAMLLALALVLQPLFALLYAAGLAANSTPLIAVALAVAGCTLAAGFCGVALGRRARLQAAVALSVPARTLRRVPLWTVEKFDRWASTHLH